MNKNERLKNLYDLVIRDKPQESDFDDEDDQVRKVNEGE